MQLPCFFLVQIVSLTNPTDEFSLGHVAPFANHVLFIVDAYEDAT